MNTNGTESTEHARDGATQPGPLMSLVGYTTVERRMAGAANQLPAIALTGAKKRSFQLAGFALIVPTRDMKSA
jgi:hypothetical protein